MDNRPLGIYLLVAALLFQGLSGVAGGIGLVGDPTGEAIGFPPGWLEGSPLANYLVPGLILVTLLGIAPLLVVVGLWRRSTWSWTASLLVGVALLSWLGVEIAIIGYQPEPPLQLIYGILGILTVILVLLPSVRKHCLPPEAS